MQIARKTGATTLFLAGVFLSLAVMMLPDVANAHAEAIHLAEPAAADADPLHGKAGEIAIDRHCDPGFDCQATAIFVHNPTTHPAVVVNVHRFANGWIDLQSRIVPFDLPPPRRRS